MVKIKKYQILDHPSDLKIRAFGRTKEELFLNILLGMSKSQRPQIKSGKKNRREIKIKSIDLPSLLVDFLNEVLYQSQVNKEVCEDINFKKFNDFQLEAEIFGKKIEGFGEDIKAATHHNINICRNSDEIWEATVLFDV